MARASADLDKAAGPPPGSYGLATILFLVAECIFAWPWLSGRLGIPYDAKAHFWPQLVFLSHALHTGDSPFWAPNVFAGTPQIADPQSLIFTPPYLLLAWLDAAPSFREADAVVFIMLTLAGIGMIMFFRDNRWHPAGALLAALALTCGGSAAWRIQHVGEVLSLCWFVLALWLEARAVQRGSVAWALAAGVAMGFMLIGRDQIAYLSAMVLAAHVAYGVARAGLGGRLVPVISMGAVCLAVSAVPVALTEVFAVQSNRPSIDYATAVIGSLRPADFLTAVCADLFGTATYNYWGPAGSDTQSHVLARNMGDVYFGALPLLALLVCLVTKPAVFTREVRFFAATAVLLVLYALGDSTPFFHLAFHIPGIDLFRRPADATFPLGAMIALLAGYALHKLMSDQRFSTVGVGLRALAIAAGLFGICIGFAATRGHLRQALPALETGLLLFLLSGAILLVLVRYGKTHPKLAMVILAAVLIADLHLSNGPNDSTALPIAAFDPLRADTQNETIGFLKHWLAGHTEAGDRDRAELAGLRRYPFYWANAGLVHGFDHDLGYNPLRLDIFTKAVRAGDQIAEPSERKFGGLFPSYRSPLANLLGIHLIATGEPIERLDTRLRGDEFPLLAQTEDAYIYENTQAMPRVFLATQAADADFDDMLSTGVWPAVDLSRVVLLQKGAGSRRSSGVGGGTARILAYHNADVEIEAAAPEGGYVVLNDVWQSWWQVEVDGLAVPLLRANVMFRAVEIPPGQHLVRFTFHPFAGAWRQAKGAVEAAINRTD